MKHIFGHKNLPHNVPQRNNTMKARTRNAIHRRSREEQTDSPQGRNTMKVRTSRFITGCLLLLAILGAAMTPAHAYDPQTTCQITLWFDTNFENPSNLSGGAGNPPPGSKIVGTGAAAVPRFSGSVGVGLSKYVMRVDDMNPLLSSFLTIQLEPSVTLVTAMRSSSRLARSPRVKIPSHSPSSSSSHSTDSAAHSPSWAEALYRS